MKEVSLEHFPAKWMPVGRKKVLKANNLEHFPAKWMPVGRKKVLKANNLERRSDFIRSSSALVIATLLLVTPAVAEETAPSARYSMTPIDVRFPSRVRTNCAARVHSS